MKIINPSTLNLTSTKKNSFGIKMMKKIPKVSFRISLAKSCTSNFKLTAVSVTILSITKMYSNTFKVNRKRKSNFCSELRSSHQSTKVKNRSDRAAPQPLIIQAFLKTRHNPAHFRKRLKRNLIYTIGQRIANTKTGV